MTKRTKIEAQLLPEAAVQPKAPKGKIAILIGLLTRPEGATIAAMMETTGWQAHSVRGAISGSIKMALGVAVISEKTEAGRTYRIAAEDAA